MALFHIFLFWFSVRLGSIIIGILTMIQGCFWFTYMLLTLDDVPNFSRYLKTIFNSFGLHSEIFNNIIVDPSSLIKFSIIYFFLLILFSVILILGAYKIQVHLIYPFIFVYSIYIVFLALEILSFIMGLKFNESGLGDMILYSNLGTFLLLFYLYTLGTVVSFVQIVNTLEKTLNEKIVMVKPAELRIDAFKNTCTSKEKYFEYMKKFAE